MEKSDQKRSGILEVAKKKRQIYILQKLQKGKTLSRAELKELEKIEGDKLPDGIIDTQEKLAQIFGVSSRTVRNWEKEDMPKTRDGFYDIKAIQEWRFFRDKRKKGDKSKKGKDWEGEYRRYKALLAEMEWKERKGQLILVKDVERDSVKKIIVVKQKFLALPHTVAPQLAGLGVRKIEEVLRIRIEEIIDDFAQGKTSAPGKKKR